MEDSSVIAATISKSVAGSKTKTLTGAQLRFILKTAHADFVPLNYSARNLRAFIRQFVPDVVERGRAGADVVYGGKEPEQEPAPVEQISLFDRGASSLPRTPLDSLLTDPRVWKTFASPQSPWRLFLNLRSGVVKVINPTEAAPDVSPWVLIPPCPAEVLLQIARDFVATVPETFQPLLARTFEDKKWWLPFFEVLQALGLRPKWIPFRRRRIVVEFERIITTLMRESPDGAQKELPRERQLPTPAAPAAGLETTRKLAIEAVGRMTEGELRSLNLPLGYVLDALNLR